MPGAVDARQADAGRRRYDPGVNPACLPPPALRRALRAFALACALALAGPAHPFVLGVLAPDGADDAVAAWEPTRAHLERSLGQPFMLRSLDLAALRTAVAAGTVDFFVANSGFYVEMEVAHGASRIATLDAPPALSPALAIASAVVVRSDRADLARFADLRGRRIATAGTEGFGGWQIAWGVFAGAGLDPARDFAAVDVTGFPMRGALDRVVAGQSDAAVVRACLLEALARRGEIDAARLRVLERPADDRFACQRSTPLYPDWPFATVRHIDPRTARSVAVALLAMPAADGASWTIPVDYQAVHALFRDLGIGPYARLRAEPTLADLARRYWWVLGLALLFAAGGFLHNMRVEAMVQRRTRELVRSREAQAELAREGRAQQEKLDHLARLGILGEMASMLAHELNQPLAAIANFARGIARRLAQGPTDPAPLIGAANEIAEQAERAAGVLDRIRGFARKRPVEHPTIDLADVARESVQLFRGMVPGAPDVALACEPARVRGDRLQLGQVLLNLLKNAYDATRALPAGDARVELTCRSDGTSVHVVVTDNGSGLAAADRERLFEPFYTTKPDGVGLGLAMSLRVVEAHGGRLWAEAPASGRGLAVGFTLPALHEERT